MIDNLISDPMKKIGLIWSYILKDRNFLIFSNFFRFFMNFFEFKINLFDLNSVFFLRRWHGSTWGV